GLTHRLLTTALLSVRYQLDLLEPGGGLGVTGGAVVPTWRERAARTDLGGVRHTAALELADLEEAPGKDFEPALDLTNGVLVPTLLRDVWPAPQGAVTPGAIGQEGHLRRGISRTGGVVYEKVMQFVGPDHLLGLLARLACGAVTRDEFGADLGI